MIYDSIVIGGGVVGAAAAYTLSKYDINIAVLEKENDVAIGTTKANSGIIHSGYDPKPGTLMAKLNVRGATLTKEICEKLDVAYKQIGALVLAFNEEEHETLKRLLQQGRENGVEHLEILTQNQIFEIEKNISKDVTAALYSPTVAVVEPWDLCLAMLETAVKNGAELFRDSMVTHIKKEEYGFLIKTQNRIFKTKTIFNAAGIHADKIHNMVAKESYKIFPAKGEYYLLDKTQGDSVHHVIFKAPKGETKGVLVAPTVHGNLIAGPNSDKSGENIATTQEGLDFVRQSASCMVSDIRYNENIRNFAGLRAISDRDDFIIEEAKDAKGFFDLAGIKSPGLSAACAIGELTVDFLKNLKMDLKEKSNIKDCRRVFRFNTLTQEEKQKAVKENPDYGDVICRCETITKGEIINCLNSLIPPVSVDGVKRRVGAGMGRCQGGFCGSKVLNIIAHHQNKSPLEVPLDKSGSYILIKKTKRGVKENV